MRLVKYGVFCGHGCYSNWQKEVLWQGIRPRKKVKRDERGNQGSADSNDT